MYDRLFPDDNPTAVRRWRLTVSQLLFAIVGFCLFTAAAMTTGVPLAGELVWEQNVRHKVEETAKPLKEQLEAVKAEQGKQRDLLTRIAASVDQQLMQSKASQIRLLVLKRCRATPNSVERESITREIEQAQEEYAAIRGGPYAPPSCSDL